MGLQVAKEVDDLGGLGKFSKGCAFTSSDGGGELFINGPLVPMFVNLKRMGILEGPITTMRVAEDCWCS